LFGAHETSLPGGYPRVACPAIYRGDEVPKFKTANQEKREAYKEEFWPNEIAWTGSSLS
jgi:hypothetical protein